MSTLFMLGLTGLTKLISLLGLAGLMGLLPTLIFQKPKSDSTLDLIVYVEAHNHHHHRSSSMAKRELSSTLKNLKFMQRGAPKKAAPDEQVAVLVNVDDKSKPISTPNSANRCIVIMEGDPHPSASRGRMSFQNFNPSIDKLNEQGASNSQKQANSSSVDHDNGRISGRGDEASKSQSLDSNVETTSNDLYVDLKRKQSESERDTKTPNKLPKHENRKSEGQSSSQNKKNGPYNQQMREKLDWNILRPPKAK